MTGREVLILRCSKCQTELIFQWNSVWGYQVAPCQICFPDKKIIRSEKSEFVKTKMQWAKPPSYNWRVYPPGEETGPCDYQLGSCYKEYRLVGYIFSNAEVDEVVPHSFPIVCRRPEYGSLEVQKAQSAVWQRED